MFGGSVVAIIGVFFVVGKGQSDFALSSGVLFIFLAMLTFAVSIILVRKLTERLDSFITTVYMTVTGSVLLVPSALTFESPLHFSPNLWAWALMLGTAIVMQGMCALIWNHQLQFVGAGKASIFLNLQPFVAMIVGFLLLGTTVTVSQIAGSVFIVFGVIVATTHAKAKEMVHLKEPSVKV
jgi:drug/metabolite transporter (DMT)-like permease